jgi:hypothetical protein
MHATVASREEFHRNRAEPLIGHRATVFEGHNKSLA